MKMSFSTAPAAPRTFRSIGSILVEAGLLTKVDVDRVLEEQAHKPLLFGEAAIQLGLVTQADVQHALSGQFEFSYLRSGTKTTSISEEVIAAFQPFSDRADQLRALRSQLMLRWFNKAESRQVLTIVGAERGEGRSYLAANLAVLFAQMGERTLLVDADLRSPRQHELFKLENRSGLSTMLSGRAREESIVRITDLGGLFVLPSGPVPPNPLELLGRHSFGEFLTAARTSFDAVIVDSPAFERGEDCALISSLGGAALVIARSERTRVAAFSDLVQGLMNSGVAVVGSVLNDVPSKRRLRK